MAAAGEPGVETDGHVTQWQRWETNGDEKEGGKKIIRGSEQQSARLCLSLGGVGAESWTGG